MDTREQEVQQQLQAIRDDLTRRVANGVIPGVDRFKSDYTKKEKAAHISTSNGLRLVTFANEGHLRGSEGKGVESVIIAIEDLGGDQELIDLIKRMHGDIPVRGIEVVMHDDLDRDENIGRGRLIDPGPYLNVGREARGGAYTMTSTYTYVSPEVTAALINRMPVEPPQTKAPSL